MHSVCLAQGLLCSREGLRKQYYVFGGLDAVHVDLLFISDLFNHKRSSSR